jgi:HAD superfamily hydrolase (TIGR01509 family)
MNIYDYKLYVFDLDGTIIDSEYSHYLAYKNQINELTFTEYEEVFHTTLKNNYINVNKIDINKKEKDFKNIYIKNKSYIEGFKDLLNNLITKSKTLCVVTNSSKERCEFIKQCHPELNVIPIWITKDDVKQPKPNSDCYLKALQQFDILAKDTIVFEDSYVGYLALKNLNINKVFICKNSYTHIAKIENISHNYNNIFINKFDNSNINIDGYITQINECKNNIENQSDFLVNYITNQTYNKIYTLGIGKMNVMYKRILSSWKSIGIEVDNLNSEYLNHGEFGILKKNDIILFCSNSGNTLEIINICKHIRKFLELKIILITNNIQSKISEYTDLSITLSKCKVQEIDNDNNIPSVSITIFNIFFDMVGLKLMKKLKIENNFSLNHPNGSIGKQKRKIIDYVVISACGRGERLYPYTKNIPKILINIDNDSFINKLVTYWSKYTKQIIILIDKKYLELLNFYIKDYKNVSLITLDIQDEKFENGWTLYSCLKDNKLLNKKVVITWCDILPCDIDILIFENKNIIFTHSDNSRYFADENVLIKKSNGNVVGLYYFHNFKHLKQPSRQDDFCDIYIDNFQDFTVYNLESLIDIGDMEKIKNYIENKNYKFQTRFFNQITQFDDNYIVKKCIDKNYENIIMNEIYFYQYMKLKLYTDNIPKIEFLNNITFKIELIQGIHIDFDDLKLTLENIDKIHSLETINISKFQITEDFYIEFYEKIINRLQNVKQIIEHFSFIKKINNIDCNITIDLFKNIVSDLYLKIIKLIDTNKQYNIIHGDCTFSNTIKTLDSKIKYIDPRGYFGKTKLFGPIEYDYSKILYSMSGYDIFNKDLLYCFEYINDNSIEIDTTYINNLDKCKTVFENIGIDFELCLYMVIIHWIGLSDYNKNNLNKCISSLFIALVIYNKFI